MPTPTGTYDILIIDNEEQICNLVKVFLGTSSFINSVVTADSTTFALQKMQNQKFDMIIVDHVMPGKTGIEFIEHISKIFQYQSVKHLLISGYLKRDDVQWAINVGVKNILVKPFTREQLLDKVLGILNPK